VKQADHHNTDYQQGSVMMEMEVHKLANGMTKASCQGFEVSDYNQETAVVNLQNQLERALLEGQLRPDM
jgi:hypothetical protein